MNRRTFISLLTGAAAWPVPARAQQAGGVRRVGALLGGDESDPGRKDRLAWFTQGLAELGWIEGRNLHLEVRGGASDPDLMRMAAKELVDLQPDVIFVITPAATRALQGQTQTIPIIFGGVGDPVAGGLLMSVAKPEGNTTGVTNFIPSMGGKWLELLKEAVPRLTRVALVFNPDISTGIYFRSLEAAGLNLGVRVLRTPFRDAADLVRAIDTFAAESNGGVIVLPPAPIGSNRALMNRLAAEFALPTIYQDRGYAAEGGLMSYGTVARDQSRGGAIYVDRILRGTKVADLPVQFPTKFELVVNLRTAKAMGLMIPESFLLRADDLIE